MVGQFDGNQDGATNEVNVFDFSDEIHTFFLFYCHSKS